MRKSTLEDLIWVCLEIGKGKLYVGGIYLVPNTSSRANKVLNQIAEMEQDIATYTLDGRVLIAGDWKQDWTTGFGSRDRVWTRRSVSDTVDTRAGRGKHIMGVMNASHTHTHGSIA